MVELDGAQGEGGGQILRTALTLAALTGQAVHVRNVRAARRNPGLAPQHLAVVLSLAQVCAAEVEGAALRSTELTFRPGAPPAAGDYYCDVAAAAQGGSAGAVSLILQALLPPLALAGGESRARLKGGTHVPWSPSCHYVQHVYLPMLARLGVRAEVNLEAWGFYPAGGGEVSATITDAQLPLTSFRCTERGALKRVHGVAVAANLPAHIPQRMANRAASLLKENGVRAQVEPLRIRSAGPGAGLFLAAEYEHTLAGFAALGAKGKPSERVAEEAALDLLAFHSHAEAALDMHLADQLLLPAALAEGISEYTTCRITGHLLTNALVIRQFVPARIEIEGEEGQAGR